MRKLLAGLGILIAVIIIALLVAPMFIPAETYKSRLEAEASRMLGRTVTIAGVPKAALFPNPAFTVEGLTIANAPDMGEEPFVSVGEADLGVKLWPLLSGEVEIARFVLTEPDINLEKTADGRVNWVLGTGDEDESDETDRNDNDANSGSGLRDLRLGEVRIVDGAITYRDGASDQLFTASDADITLTLDSLDAPLGASGTMLFQGSPAQFDARLSTPRSLMAQAESMIALTFTVEDNNVDTDITLAGGELAYNGDLRIDAPSLKSLLATLGMPIEAENGFDRLVLDGTVRGSSEALSFSNATLTFDEITGIGDIDFAWSGARPKVTGTLDLSRLDLTPYLPPATEAEKANREDKNAAFPPWPEERIDFSPLRTIDADLTATTDGIILPTMRFERSRLDVDIVNGVLAAQLREVNLYNGGGNGSVRVDARGQVPTLSTTLDLTGLNAQSFARDVLGLNRLTGVGQVQADLTMRGNSVAAFMRSLNGEGTLQLDEGALEGIDIGKMLRTASTLVSGFSEGSFNPQVLVTAVSEARGGGEETEFTELATPFTITDGVVRSQNIYLKGPLFIVKGDGTVNLPEQTIDMAFVPTVFQGLEDETGRTLGLPLMIGGSFNDPTVGFNTKALLQEAASGRIRDLLNRNGVAVGESQSISDALESRARSEIGKALGLGGKPTETPDAGKGEEGEGEAATEEEEEEASLEDQLKERALDAIFGARKKKDQSEQDE